jgi:hypothetical protein
LGFPAETAQVTAEMFKFDDAMWPFGLDAAVPTVELQKSVAAAQAGFGLLGVVTMNVVSVHPTVGSPRLSETKMVLFGAVVVCVWPFSVIAGRVISGHVSRGYPVDPGALQLRTSCPPLTCWLIGWSTGGVPIVTVTVPAVLVKGPPMVVGELSVAV